MNRTAISLRGLIYLCIYLLVLVPTFCQETGEPIHTGEHEENKWRVAIAMINSHVPAIDDSRARVIIPTWGLDVDYKIAEKWAIGLMLDVELQSYRVTHGDFTELEREFPVTLGLAMIFEATHNLTFGAGFAREFEPNENFDMVLLTGSYTFHLPNSFDISPGFTYNTRIDAFDTFSFNLAIGKSF